MTLAEILKTCGVADETAQAVQDAMKQNGIYTASEENLDVRYGKLKNQHESTTAQLTQAQALIDEMKKSTKGNEELQGKITDYEGRVAALEAELEKTKVSYAARIALMENGATDVDYMVWQLTKDGEELALGEDGKIKGWDDKLAGLKTRFPNHFDSPAQRKYEEHKLPTGTKTEQPVTREQFLQMSYADRLKLKQENESLYRQLSAK